MQKITFLFALILAVVSCGDGPSNGSESQVVTAQMGDFDPEAKIKELGIELPVPGKPVANFVSAVRTCNLIFL